MTTTLRIKERKGRTTATAPDGAILVDVTASYGQPTTFETPSGRFVVVPGSVTDASGAVVATASTTRSLLFSHATELVLASGEVIVEGAKNKLLRPGTWQAVPQARPKEVWASARHLGFGKIQFRVEDVLMAHPERDLLIGLFVNSGVAHVRTQIALKQ